MTYVDKQAENFTDSRIFFRRPLDNSVYCVMAPATVARYRKAGELDNYLKQQRDSGIVIRAIKK